MFEFQKIKRLPPYVFAIVNELSKMSDKNRWMNVITSNDKRD
ncbi:hypothetical protein MCHI_000630 [Candidatus Magnetoovum chiemensis]|nr:hypothetical protein MCHI_000630 [Candidatus Magnetoovum chiemensis]